MSRGQLRSQIKPETGDAVILVLEDDPDVEPLWLDVFRWRLAIGFRDLEDPAPLSVWGHFLAISKRLRYGPDIGIPQNRMMPKHALRVVAFVQSLPIDGTVRRLLVACEYGRSRSVSIARFAAETKGWTFSSDLPGNVRVSRLLRSL